MRKFISGIAAVVVGLAASFAIVGCSNSTSTPAKMAGDKMDSKMKDDKMGGDKMDTKMKDKM